MKEYSVTDYSYTLVKNGTISVPDNITRREKISEYISNNYDRIVFKEVAPRFFGFDFDFEPKEDN